MSYHLNRQGANLGVFTLEELRRRRAVGQFDGTEMAWCPGMADWQTLDVVLGQAALGAARVLPPPIPAWARKKQTSRRVVWAVAALVLLAVTGAALFGGRVMRAARQVKVLRQGRPSGADVAVASKPIVWDPKTRTEADVHKDAQAFRLRQWVEGYRERGQHGGACDADSLRFLETWIATNYGGEQATDRATEAQLGDKIAATPGCDDPLVLTAAGVTSIELHESIRRLERAVSGFEQSKHRAYPRLYATVSLAGKLRDDPARAKELYAEGMKLFQQSFTDGSFQPGDQAQVADIFITGWGHNFFRRHGATSYFAARSAGKSYAWLELMLEGEYNVDAAWRARGSGYADSVNEKGWQDFATRLAKARRCFTSAWNLRPDLPLAASRMIYVSLGDTGIEEMRLWFDRAVAVQADHPGTWSNLRWGLRPRWHGSPESMLALGVTALNTRHFETDVPHQFFGVVTDLESELSLRPGEHIYGRADIWPRLQQMYEGYLGEPSQAATRDGWHSAYAVVAYLAGKYTVAGKQLEAVNWEPQAAKLKGWGADLSLMSLEVAARTGPASARVSAAEATYRYGAASQAVRAFKQVLETPNLDERTRRFVRCRLASLDFEQRFQAGDWMDLRPAEPEDPAWVNPFGKYRPLPEGDLEVQSGPEGHMIFSRARVGMEFEVRGEFEVVRSSSKSFQAGLVMGRPEFSSFDWYAFRVKRNDVEGDLAAFSSGWSTDQVYQKVRLNDDRNSFVFRFQRGAATVSVNGKEIMKNAKLPQGIRVEGNQFLLGVGAFNDMNDTVIRYHNLQVRKVGAN